MIERSSGEHTEIVDVARLVPCSQTRTAGELSEEAGNVEQGPQTSRGHLAAYLRAEQRLGRVRADAELEFCAEIILGLCFQRAFRQRFMEHRTTNKKDYSQSHSEFANTLADAMVRLLGPL
jgi:hypothetical protein